MHVAVYPGTFDPVHNGHIDIATRAAGVFEKLVVAVYDRPNNKNVLFTTQERIDLMSRSLQHLSNVTVVSYSGLTVSFVRKCGARVIVRGLRVTYDFELEYQMALTNKKLAPDLETVCLMTSLDYAFLSSSIVKEVAAAGGCVEAMVPPHVISALRAKLDSSPAEASKVKLVSLCD
jgi:pantetheine-phosphate adenylyltransferase